MREAETGWIPEAETMGYAPGSDARGHVVYRNWGPRLPMTHLTGCCVEETRVRRKQLARGIAVERSLI